MVPLRKVIAVSAGNALEFYDFLTYSFFAIQIGRCFFPDAEGGRGLLYSLATFGVGFVTRPLGGLVIGVYGDRVGRKPAMILSFGLMGVAIAGLGLTPGYDQIGMAAPVLLILFRLLQGFALGGEVGPTTAFLIETAPIEKRGLYSSLQTTTQQGAILVAGVVGFILSTSLSAESLDAWGWRVALLGGLLIVPVGLYVRSQLPETREEGTAKEKPSIPLMRMAVLAVMLLAAATIGTYVPTYLVTYGQDVLELPPRLAFGATIAMGLVGIVAHPLGGILSDRFGRRPVMLIAALAALLAAAPVFFGLVLLREAWALYAVSALYSLLLGLFCVPAIAAITEGLPSHLRSGGLGILYALAISIFGGSAQFIVKFLSDLTASPLVPAWYLMAGYALGAIAIVVLPETAPGRREIRRVHTENGGREEE